MNLDQASIKKIRQLIVFAAIIVIALWNYARILEWIEVAFNIVFPFLLGGGIAFVLNVPMNFLETKLFRNRYLKDKKAVKKIARPVSLLFTIGIVVGVIVLIMFVVIPELTKTVLSLGKTIQDAIPQIQQFLQSFFTDNKEAGRWFDGLNLSVDRLTNQAAAFFQNGAGDMLNSTMSAIGSIVSGVATFVIAFVFGCYVLLQKEKLRIQIQKVMYAFLSEEKVKWCLEVCHLTYKSFSSFLTGQCVEALILGTLFFIAMTIFRMPYTLLVALLIAVTALIPIFGAFIGCLIGVLLILMINPLQALGFLIMFLVIQQIEGNVIYPKVVGKSVGLPSIWVLAAVTIGGNLMGVVGMLIFIPIVSVIYTLFRASVYKRLRRKYRDRNPQEQGSDNKEENDSPDL